MPLYEYVCVSHGHFEATKSITERSVASCPTCKMEAPKILTTVRFSAKMGCDPDFPTAAAKWDKSRRDRATGRMKDSNNTSYGTNHDIERDAYDAKKRGV